MSRLVISRGGGSKWHPPTSKSHPRKALPAAPQSNCRNVRKRVMFEHRSCITRGAKDTPVSQFDSGDRIATVVHSRSVRRWQLDEFAACESKCLDSGAFRFPDFPELWREREQRFAWISGPRRSGSTYSQGKALAAQVRASKRAAAVVFVRD